MSSAANEVRVSAAPANSTAKTLGILFLYSVAMFTLPFFAFFGVQHALTDYYPVSPFAKTCWSVLASVVVVNILIMAYAYQGYHEKEYDDDGNEIDQHSYPASSSADKAQLNVKQD